jgi:hypothetical protein
MFGRLDGLNLDEVARRQRAKVALAVNNAMQQTGRARRGQSSTPAAQQGRGKVAATATPVTG